MSILSKFYETKNSIVGSQYDEGLNGEKPSTSLVRGVTQVNDTFSKGTYEEYLLAANALDAAASEGSRGVDTTS